MPYINLKVAGKLTAAQRKQIAKEFAATLERVAKKPRSHTYLVIDEVPRDRWAIGDRFLNQKK